jgi:hypothetical protein
MKPFVTILLFLVCLLKAQADSSFTSPNGHYSVTIVEDEFRVRNLTIMQDNKRLFGTSSGYGGYTAVSWSLDSKYLAVVEHGTKTTMTLAVYLVGADKIKAITLPDYRMNILGRHHKVDGGRYWFDEALRWDKGNALEFVTRGSLVDGASNAQDDPANWYCFHVRIEVLSDRAHLRTVSPKEEDEQDGTGQPATRSQSKSEGGDKLQPESERRSR